MLRMTSKLSNAKAFPKTYWFLCDKKIRSIPPLLVNSKFISDFRAKANLFNDFFASIYTPINNGSTLPQFAYKTNAKINFFRVNQNDISLIMKTLDAKKAHGWDNISIKMMQICCDPIALSLMLVFETTLKEKRLSDIQIKANVVPVHKKRRKYFIKKLSSYYLTPHF